MPKILRGVQEREGVRLVDVGREHDPQDRERHDRSIQPKDVLVRQPTDPALNLARRNSRHPLRVPYDLRVPYRVDLRAGAVEDVLDRLVELGALDVDLPADGRIAALLPDSVSPEQVARALGIAHLLVSPAVGRDAGSVWVLEPRPTEIGRLRIVPAHMEAGPGDLRLADAAAFGTGLHPTTALCLEALQ
jgi:hypothetical protein